MTCPNDDKNFSEMLAKILKHPPTPENRKQIFYFVCIVFRICLLLFLYYYSTNKNVQYLYCIFTLFALINLFTAIKNGPNTQWWSKKFQFTMSFIMLCASLLVIFKKIDSIYLPILFGISLLGGFLQSLLITFC